MTIEEWIELAIRDGDFPREEYTNVNAVLLNRKFWQSLSKARGWGKRHFRVAGLYVYEIQVSTSSTDNRHKNCNQLCKEEWLYHWHCFIDHLAEGKTAESFFESLQ